MKEKNTENMIKESEKLNTAPSLLFFSAAGTYKRLASLLATKHLQPYSSTMGWLRCMISFSLLRSAITCLRGAHSTPGHPVSPTQVSDTSFQLQLPLICSYLRLDAYYFLYLHNTLNFYQMLQNYRVSNLVWSPAVLIYTNTRHTY